MLHTKCVCCEPHGSREEEFLKFSHYNSMETLDLGRASLNPGFDWQDLCRGPLDIATFQIYYTIIDFNEVDIRIYLPEKVIIHRGR